MLFIYFYSLRDLWGGFNVFRYITFRSFMAIVFGFFISWWLIGLGKEILKRWQFGQVTRTGEQCPILSDWHSKKSGTPTMGGIFLILSIVLTWILWVDLSSWMLWLCVYILLHLGILGFWDDWLKLKKKSSSGISKKAKLFHQFIVGVIVAICVGLSKDITSQIHFPFFKDVVVNLGIFYFLWSILVISGSSNAVNLTDGMDGLAIGCSVMVFLTYALLSYVAGHRIIADYLLVPYVRGAGELAVICASVFGCGLGYLWYNAYPAQVFMGDVGALALGGLIGGISLLIKQELLLIVSGGVFVVEALSVIVQVISFKFFGRRVFRVAPIHHHFYAKGIDEVKVTIRFWIVSGLLAVLTLACLKLR